MFQKFSKSIFELSQLYDQIASAKYQIAQSVTFQSGCKQESICYQTITAFELMQILEEKTGRKIDISCLQKIFTSYMNQLDTIKMHKYFEIPLYPKVNITRIFKTQLFCDLMVLQSKLFSHLQQIKNQYSIYSQDIFEGIDNHKSNILNPISLSSFIKTHSGLILNSRIVRYFFQSIIGQKQDILSKQQWMKYFNFEQRKEISRSSSKLKAGKIKNNSMKKIQIKQSVYKSIQEIESLKTNPNCYQQSYNLSSITKHLSPKPKQLKRVGSIKRLINNQNNQNTITSSNKIKIKIDINNYRFHDSYRVPILDYQCNQSISSHKLKSSADQTFEQKTQRIKQSSIKKNSIVKHPYEQYLSNKKVSNIQQTLNNHISEFNQLCNRKQQLISRIYKFKQFNLFNAFNVLDSYDIGSINFGEFCRQIDFLNLNVSDSNKKYFWNYITQGKKQLCFEKFVQLFKTKSNCYFEELRNRQPAIRKFEGLKSWGRQLQIQYKHFLKQIIDIVLNTKKIEDKIKGINESNKDGSIQIHKKDNTLFQLRESLQNNLCKKYSRTHKPYRYSAR